MAIDAEGIAFMIARKTYKYNDWVIIKINIDRDNLAGWTYSIMGDTLKKYSTNSAWNSENDIDGLAFYKGKLYALQNYGTSNTKYGRLYQINPMDGTVRELTNIDHNGFDLASCDVTVSLTGKIYNDTDGDGIITGSEPGIGNVVVEIYDKTNKYKGSTTTDSMGVYNFLLDESGSDAYFTIRVKQPKINDINAAQTWASGGQF